MKTGLRTLGVALILAGRVGIVGLAAPEQAGDREADSTFVQPALSSLYALGLFLGDPIMANSGQYYFELPLMNLGGPMPIRFTLRHRGSQPTSDGLPRVSGFQHTLDPEVTWSHFAGSEQEITAFLRNDEILSFGWHAASNRWVLDPTTPTRYEFHETGPDRTNGWYCLSDPMRGQVYVFEKNVQHTYDEWAHARLRYRMDRNGNTHTYTYASGNQGKFVETITDSLGRTLQFQYDFDKLTDVVDSAGRRVRLLHEDNALDASSNSVLRAVVDPGGGTNVFHYFYTNWAAAVTAWVHPNGNTPYTQTYADVVLNGETNLRVVTQTDAYGNSTTLGYDPQTNRVTETRADATAVNYEHNGNHGLPRGLRDAAGNAGAFRQNDRRQITSMTDRMGDMTEVGYDARSGKVEWYRDAEGNLYSNTYMAVSQVFVNPANGEQYTNTFYDLTRGDYPDGTYETYGTDGRGNVTMRVDRVGHTWLYTYNARGQVLTVTGPEGGVMRYTYNPDATVATRTDSDTGDTTYEYDAFRRPVRVYPPDGTMVAMAYDLNDRLTSYTDADGRVTTYDYDANGNLLWLTDPLAHARGYMYDEMDRVTNVTDSVGPVVTYGYDALGRLESVADANGQATVQTYDPRGWVTNVTRDGESWATGYDPEGVPSSGVTPRGRETTYRTDKLGMTTGVVDALDQAYVLERDALGRVVRGEDPLGRAVTYEYDAAGNVVGVTVPLVGTATAVRNGLGLTIVRTNFNGETWTYGYTPMGRLAAVTNPLGHATEYSYDTMGRRKRTDYADGTHAEVAYDDVGRVQTRQGRGGHVMSYGYDELDRTTGITNPAGGVVAYAYNPDGTFATRTDADVGVYSNRYDALRRLERVTAPDGATTRYEYDAFNRVTNVVDPLAHARGYEYDADGRLVRETDPLAHARGYAYDALGRLTNLTDRLGNAVRYEYDAVGNLVRSTDPEGVVVEHGYDAADRRTATTLGGQTWRYGYDDESRLTSRTTPLGHTTLMTRDAMGSLKTITDPMGHTTMFMRDELQRPTAVVDRLGRTNAFSYEPRGLLAGVSNAVSEARYTYDELGGLQILTDPNGEDWTFGYTRMGRIETAVDPLSRTNAYAYDLQGRTAGIAFPDGHGVTVVRDAAGNVTNRTYTDGTTITYEYDPLNRLVGTKGTTLGISFTYDGEGRVTATDNPGMVFGASHDKAGRLKTAAYSNGAFIVTYTYDASGLLTQVEDSLTRTVLTFSYDADRRLTRIMRPNGVNTTYTWDDADRIVRIRDGSVLDLSYELDAEGQLTAARIKAPLTTASLLASGARTDTFDAASQLSTAGHAYDVRGRQTANPDGTFTWNDAGHLTEISHTSYTSHMSYNGPGDLVTRSEGAATTHFYYNYAIAMKPIVAERDDVGGQFLRYYVWTPDGRLLYMIDVLAGNKVYHYHFDRVGSTLALTDDAGAVTDAYVYAPYGALLAHAGSSAQAFTFVGRWGVRQEGAAGGLYHMRARYYDAGEGRFLSRDPAWPGLTRIGDLNPYQYAREAPVDHIDPSGLHPYHIIWNPDPEVPDPYWPGGVTLSDIEPVPPMPLEAFRVAGRNAQAAEARAHVAKAVGEAASMKLSVAISAVAAPPSPSRRAWADKLKVLLRESAARSSRGTATSIIAPSVTRASHLAYGKGLRESRSGLERGASGTEPPHMGTRGATAPNPMPILPGGAPSSVYLVDSEPFEGGLDQVQIAGLGLTTPTSSTFVRESAVDPPSANASKSEAAPGVTDANSGTVGGGAFEGARAGASGYRDAETNPFTGMPRARVRLGPRVYPLHAGAQPGKIELSTSLGAALGIGASFSGSRQGPSRFYIWLTGVNWGQYLRMQLVDWNQPVRMEFVEEIAETAWQSALRLIGGGPKEPTKKGGQS